MDKNEFNGLKSRPVESGPSVGNWRIPCWAEGRCPLRKTDGTARSSWNSTSVRFFRRFRTGSTTAACPVESRRWRSLASTPDPHRNVARNQPLLNATIKITTSTR